MRGLGRLVADQVATDNRINRQRDMHGLDVVTSDHVRSKSVAGIQIRDQTVGNLGGKGRDSIPAVVGLGDCSNGSHHACSKIRSGICAVIAGR